MSLRYFAYRTRYNYGRLLSVKTPVDISLELSSACNLRCGYCYHGDPKNLPFKRNFMSFEVATNIISQAAELKVEALKFNWRGESTLYPRFDEITAFAKSLACGSTFIERTSNSNFKFNHNNEKIFKGLLNQTKVKVSFDSFIPHVLETQRKGADYSLIYKNISKFYHAKNRDTELVIQAVRTKLNKDEDIAHLVDKYWPGTSVSIRDVVEGRKDGDIDEYAHKKRDDSLRKPCDQAFVRLVFSYEGIAHPCCVDYKGELPLGDINKTSMENIFNGYIAKKLRKDLKSGKAFKNLSACKNCSSFESYKNYQKHWGS